MNTRHTSIERTAWCAVRGAGLSVVTFAVAGARADSGFGLVVVDQGNPRRRIAISALARAH